MDQGKVQPVRVMKESQSSGRVSRENDKTPKQPPNTSFFTENRVSCSPAQGASTKKLFTAQGTAPCSRTPCSLSSISWQHGFVLIFFQNW